MFKFTIMKYALFVGMLVCQISLIIGFTIGVSHATSLFVITGETITVMILSFALLGNYNDY